MSDHDRNDRGSRNTRFEASISLALGVTLAFAIPSAAQDECLQIFAQPLHNTSSDCTSIPEIDRFIQATTFDWSGAEYLAFNTGNDIQLWNVSIPSNPAVGDDSEFDIDPPGDVDYGLMNFSICDGCPLGVASFRTGTMLFSLGSGDAPVFGSREFHPEASPAMGGFTFEHDGQQYLISNDLPDPCPTGNAALYEFDGITAGGLNRVGCVEVPGTVTRVFGGFYLQSMAGEAHLYIGTSDLRVRIFRVDEIGAAIDLSYVDLGANTLRASLGRGRGMDVDEAHGLAVTAYGTQARIYDVHDPGDPVLLRSLDFPSMVNLAAIRYPFAWLARKGFEESSVTYDVSSPAYPRPLDPGFWDSSQWWNDYDCQNPHEAVFSADASTMYFARFSVAQMVDFSGCNRLLFADGFESGDSSAWSATVD